jgi:predicted permease
MYNYGYIPYPLVEQLYRDPQEMRRTMGVLVVHNMGVEVAMWSVGVLLMSGALGRGWWRRVLNPPVLAILGAWGCNLVGVDRGHPALSPVFAAVELVGQVAIPLGLLLVGATLADLWHPRVLWGGWRTLVGGCVLRLGVLPVLALGVVAAWKDASVELQRVMAIQAAMPAALFPIVLARLYGGDPLVALRVVLATSLGSTVTTPLWLPLGLSLVRG